jgi:hypothetical protein
MAVAGAAGSAVRPSRIALGFVVGVLATLIFHEIGVELCHLAGLSQNKPYNLTPVPPFGVPRVVSLAFWGGVWAIALVLAEKPMARFPAGYWIAATAFGAIVPTVFSWLVIAPLRGQPLGYGFQLARTLSGLIVNGLWGLGTGVLLTLLAGRRAGQPASPQSDHSAAMAPRR